MARHMIRGGIMLVAGAAGMFSFGHQALKSVDELDTAHKRSSNEIAKVFKFVGDQATELAILRGESTHVTLDKARPDVPHALEHADLEWLAIGASVLLISGGVVDVRK